MNENTRKNVLNDFLFQIKWILKTKVLYFFIKWHNFIFTRVCKRSFKKAANPEIMLFVNIKSLITVISLILYNKLGGHS